MVRSFIVGGLVSLALAGSVAITPAVAPVAAPAAPISAVAYATQPYKFRNCTALNKVYKHGVGKSTAKDKTSGTPVTNFKKSTTQYKKIVGYRASLDRDKDGIACEKR